MPTAATATTHPAPTVARQVHRLLWAILAITIIALGLSLGAAFGFSSFFVTLAAVGCTLIYTITLLSVLRRDRNKDASEAFPCTAHMAAIIFAALITVAWGGATVMITVVLGMFWEHRGYDYSAEWLYVALAELPFVFTNTILFILLGLAEIRERQRLLGMPETERWYKMGQYATPEKRAGDHPLDERVGHNAA